jgi:DNA-binding IclR family transcriptional regulator
LLGTVTRAGEVLDLFDVAAPEWGASAVARRLDIGKSQAHAILLSLANIGLLRRSGRGRYRLGWRTLTMGHELLQSELDRRVVTLMAQLARSMHADVRLDALERGRLVTLARRRPSLEPPFTGLCARPMGDTATGRLLLASLTDDGPTATFEVDAIDPSIGLRSVAVPVHDCAGGVLALGVAIPAPSWAIQREALIRAATGAAARMTRFLAEPEILLHTRPERRLVARPVAAQREIA